ncbi:Vacuolar protein sorting-associated protein 9A [Acorus calamus]|uniref:Vacuolar protein sorting-associated protein 9A n=1 Tax=Acorus calamus TaxID=4465 RepID=A0AAV9DMT0_ACOCL|nr:Vacuolar protein sorting-associated protein 9A [Acorus calamus]
MENADAFVSSTAPLTWHDFLERMRHPSAADFVKSIKSFIVSFTNRVPDPERDSVSVQEFLASMEGAFRSHSLFAGCTEEELESAGEGLEKYVMTKLFNRAFASLPEDVKHDEELSEKMSLLQQFIRPENLDIKPTFQNETSWLLAQKELQKINMYKAPRDKIVCILNCCKVINNLLLNASIASNENTPGADEFLPVLIFVTIKANPPQLHSNLLYIQRYRRQSRLVSETAYYFTNILSAESFIWNIDAQSLSMDAEEFKNNMESARALLSGLETHTGNQNQDTSHHSIGEPASPEKGGTKSVNEAEKYHAPPKKPSISVLEKKGAADLLKDDELNRHFQEYPFLYASAGDLTVDDVESLLNSYKQLVLRYVCLSKGMPISSSSVSDSAKTEPQTDTMRNFEDGMNASKGEDTRIQESSSFSSLVDIDNIEMKLHTDASVRHPGPDADEAST